MTPFYKYNLKLINFYNKSFLDLTRFQEKMLIQQLFPLQIFIRMLLLMIGMKLHFFIRIEEGVDVKILI